jgi:hypothetical protein
MARPARRSSSSPVSLGHLDVAMVGKVYGRFQPDTQERDR